MFWLFSMLFDPNQHARFQTGTLWVRSRLQLAAGFWSVSSASSAEKFNGGLGVVIAVSDYQNEAHFCFHSLAYNFVCALIVLNKCSICLILHRLFNVLLVVKSLLLVISFNVLCLVGHLTRAHSISAVLEWDRIPNRRVIAWFSRNFIFSIYVCFSG